MLKQGGGEGSGGDGKEEALGTRAGGAGGGKEEHRAKSAEKAGASMNGCGPTSPSGE